MSGRFTGVEALVAGRPSGSVLSEPDAQAITTLLGVGVPRMVAVGDVNALPAFPGDTVVVKAVGPAHKARVGGVAVVANRPAAILDAAARVGTVPGAHGVVVAERVEHDPDDELIAGVRWTDAFGPVVSIGRGGSAVERGPSPAILTAALADRSEQILHSHATGALPGLGDLAAALLDLGLATMPRLLTEFEMNPIVMTPDGPVALDALAVTGTGAEPGGRLPPADDAVARLLHPASIAIVGVSDTVNPGRQILRNVIAAGFPTEAITVVKAGFEAIDGCRCVASLDSLDGPVDLLVVAIAAGGVPALVTEVLTTAAARSVVLIPGGLGERPGTAAAAERIRVAVTTARSEGRFAPALLGPNSMGVRSVPGSYDTTFIPPERMTSGERRRAGVAVVAQSGAFTLSRLDRLPWLEPDYVVSVGNQIDLTVGDHLDHFAGDPTIDIVACYVEGFAPADGDRILRAATRLTARGGTVLWHRGGRTVAGAGAAASHTAAIATDDVVATALTRAAGIVATASLEDWEGLLRLAVALRGRPVGPRAAIVSNAGFECVAAADALGGLVAAPFSAGTVQRLRQIVARHGLEGLASIADPLDLTPAADDAAFAESVAAVLDDPAVDVAVAGCVPFTPALRVLDEDPDAVAGRLAALATHPTPWVCVVDAGRHYDPFADRLESAGIPVLRSMDRAVRLLDAYVAARPRAGA